MADDDGVREELETLRADFAKLQSDVGELVQALKEAGSERVNSARDGVADELRRRRERLEERLGAARDRGRRVADEVGEEVAQRPLTSLLAAFGVGFILAKLMQGGRN